MHRRRVVLAGRGLLMVAGDRSDTRLPHLGDRQETDRLITSCHVERRLPSSSVPIRSRRRAAFVLLIGTTWLLLALPFVLGSSPFLINRTPSVPPGIYVWTADRLEPGNYVAFRAEGPGFDQLVAAGFSLPDVPLLKPVVATAGDHVCHDPGANGVRVNGDRLLPILVRRARGIELPIWQGCRVLRPGEVFVYADRIPNALDSRYIGPVTGEMIIGAYIPLWTW